MSNPINELKTSSLARRLSIAKTSLNVGKNIAKASVSGLFVSSESRQAQKDALLSEQAQYFVAELGKLKGSVVKIGQMLALYGETMLPPQIVAALHTLDDNTAPISWQVIKGAIRAELGALMDDFDIEETPIGTASLAQVHKAVHKSTGQAVVLKVQYPNVAAAIDSDLSLFRHLLKVTNAVPQTRALDAWFEEIRTLLHIEVDYQREADTTERFFERLKDDPRYVVPRIYRNYCTPRLLCMSFETGVSLNDKTLATLPQDRRDRLGQNALEIVLHELFTWGEMQTDPNFGNYLIRTREDGQDKLVLLDFGAIKAFDSKLLTIAKALLTAGHHHDHAMMVAAMNQGAGDYEFFSQMSEQVKSDMADVFLIATEPFAKADRLRTTGKDAHLSANGRYHWANSDLYNRTLSHARRCMQSKEFVLPPKELMFISRKFIGAYALLSATKASTDADKLASVFLDNAQ